MVIGPGRVNLTGLSVSRRRRRASSTKTERLRDAACDHRHLGVVAVADAHGLAPGEVDAVEVLDEGGDEMLARLLAVADGADAGAQLVVDGQAHGVALGLLERLAGKLPGRPQLLGLGKPGRLGQAAGDGGGDRLGHLGSPGRGGMARRCASPLLLA